MRKLAAFTASFALGIYLAQYLLPESRLLPLAAGCFAAACLALLLPGLWALAASLLAEPVLVRCMPTGDRPAWYWGADR